MSDTTGRFVGQPLSARTRGGEVLAVRQLPGLLARRRTAASGERAVR